MPTIEIIIDPQGLSRVQTIGFRGATCRAASQFLEQALGQIAHEQLTAEFYQLPASQHSAESERV